MAKDLLKDTECRNASSNGLKVRKLSDGGGLYLWVNSDGSKYWRLRYWLAGKEKPLSLGVYPAVSLKAAREERDRQRTLLKDEKKDPSAERRAQRIREKLSEENSFEAVAIFRNNA